jgi:hypothetical protein
MSHISELPASPSGQTRITGVLMSKSERQDVSIEIDLWLASKTAATLLRGFTENLTERDWDHIDSFKLPESQ